MAHQVKALRKPVVNSLLMRRGRVCIAAAMLLVLMGPPFGAAEEQIKWDPIPGSDLKLPYILRSRDDASPPGGHDPALPGRALGRSPTRHPGAVSYPFKLTEKHLLTPAFSLNYDDAGGEAGKNRTADIRLTYSYLGDPLVLVVNTLIEHTGYDRKDAGSGKTGNDDGFGVSASVYYTNPWDWSLFRGDAIKFFATGTYYSTDSKGDLDRQESVSAAAGISLEW